MDSQNRVGPNRSPMVIGRCSSLAPSGFTLLEAFARLLDMALAADAHVRTPRVPELITSRENRWLKQFRAALAGETPRSARKMDGDLVAVEGLRLVETALRAAVGVSAVLVSETGARRLPAFEQWIPPAARLLATSDRLFAQVAATETPQGIAALVRPHPATFDDLVRGVPLVLMMVGVQDPGNVGALVRTAEAFGASGAAVCPGGGIGTADPYGPKALRASAGSALRLPILRGVGAAVLLAQLRVAGVRVYATSPDAAAGEAARKPLAPWEVDWRGPAALLIGNEGAGLPPELVRSADALVSIPQAHAIEFAEPMNSLNAAVAGGVLLYEAARQRGLG
jgi:RNA methyltransferase, TrmH family